MATSWIGFLRITAQAPWISSEFCLISCFIQFCICIDKNVTILVISAISNRAMYNNLITRAYYL